MSEWEKILNQQHGNEWTLAEDAALAAQLKAFSMQLFEKTKELENAIWELGMDAEKADVRLNNSINHFFMLSDSQFIENRVYEEDEEENVQVNEDTPPTDATKDTTQSTDPTSESNVAKVPEEKKKEVLVVDQYRSALSLGMEALKLFAVGDEEDVLDIYNERPLPFVIGTKEFLEDEYLGLGAAPDSEDDEDDSEEYTDESEEEEEESEEESDDDDDEDDDDDDGESVDNTPPRPPMPPPRPNERWETESDDLFGTSTRTTSKAPSRGGLFGMDSDSDDDIRPAPAKNPPNQSTLFATEDMGNDLFDGRPKPAIAPPKQDFISELQARPAKLGQIDDSDDDSDGGLFGAPVSRNPPVAAPPKPAGRGNSTLFGESDSDAESTSSGLFGRESTVKLTKDESKKVIPGGVPILPPPPSMTRNESTESSLFGSSKPIAVEAKSAPPVQSRPSKQLFDSDDDDESLGLFGTGKAVAAPPPYAPPVQAPARTTQAKPTNFFDDDSDDDDSGGLFGSKPSGAPLSQPSSYQPPKQVQQPPMPVTKATGPPPLKASALFGDDSDDDSDDGGLFGRPPASKTPAPKPTVTMTETVTTTTTIAPQTRLHNLFQSEESTESSADLFGTKSPRGPGSQKNLFTSTPKAAAPPAKPAPTSLFGGGDSDNESNAGDLFGVSSSGKQTTPSAPKPVAAPAQVLPAAPIVPKVAAQPIPPKKAPDSDDDWSDDDGGLFGRASVGMSANPMPTSTSKTSLFGESSFKEPESGAGLFASTAPNSSLFGTAQSSIASIGEAKLAPTATLSAAPTSTLSSAPAATLLSTSNSSLFGSPKASSNSSLFGNPTPASTVGMSSTLFAETKAAPVVSTSSSLFGGPPTSVSTTTGLFSDSKQAPSSSSLFGATPSTTTVPSATSSTTVTSAASGPPAPPTASRLFQSNDSDSDGWSDDESSLFGPPKKK